MVCSRCSAKLADDARFCGHCGVPSDAAEAATSAIRAAGSTRGTEGPTHTRQAVTLSSKLIAVTLFVGIAMVTLKPFALLLATCFIFALFYLLPRKDVGPKVRLAAVGALLLATVIAELVVVTNERREEADIKKQQVADEEKKRQAERDFAALSPAEHLSKAKAAFTSNLGSADIVEALRHIQAIPANAPEVTQAKLLEKRLVRQQHLHEARRLIENMPVNNLKAADETLQQFKTHVQAVLKDYPNDKDAVALLRLATQKGKEVLQKDNDRIALESKAHPQPDLAFIKCQSAAEGGLKAPATASFASYSDSRVVDVGAWQYTVNSYVDAQNSFGANIRTDFSCNVACVSIGNCSVTYLHFAEQSRCIRVHAASIGSLWGGFSLPQLMLFHTVITT